MIIEVIPPRNWPKFLESFSQLHSDLPCSIDVLDGPREISAGDDLKFSNISFADEKKIDIDIKAFNRDTEINHIIRQIKQICITKTNEGAGSSILIESGGSLITSIKFTK
jgi:hypothetical protein